MLAATYEKTDGRYVRYIAVHEVDSENLLQAHAIFDDYKNKGIILNESFDDDMWQLTDQTRNVGLAFNAPSNERTMSWIGCSSRIYWQCVKAYIVFKLGKHGLLTLQDILLDFKELSAESMDEAVSRTDNIKHIIGLLQIIPGGNESRDYVIDELEEKLGSNSKNNRGGKQRQLADFSTYLKFSEILSSFWQTADSRQKLFYFPIYFWWNLTAILPLRVKEFLLTPRDCLEVGDKGENILTVRRTKLKGGFARFTYSIQGDYEIKKYVITESLADELRSYLRNTEKMQKTNIGTLLLHKPHYKYINKYMSSNNKYYSYVNLNTCLDCFYDEVIKNKSDIGRINLGDTRHIAMINLIISGGSPMICRELAGHSDIEISSHYFTNISNLVECVTYERYRMSKGKKAEMSGQAKYPIAVPKSHYRLPDGWCDSPLINDGNVSDCLKISDKVGQIGNCTHCIHFYSDIQGVRMKFLDEQIGKQAVDADCQYLMQMIELVRKGIGYTEDIGAALLRLQKSSDHYSKCLWEKYTLEKS